MYAKESIVNADREPGKRLASSRDAGWHSLLVQKVESPFLVDCYETIPTRDQAITVVLSGHSVIESASSGKWRKAQHRPGSGGSSEPYHADKLRWRTQSATPLVTAHLYIPPFFFLEAKDELNLDDLTCPNHHGFVDPLTAQIVTAVAAAAEQRYPDLYAETAARFLATHLFLSSTKRTLKLRVVRDLPDARIERVLAYIEHHLDTRMTIATLSHEAGISPFHFARLFKRRIGTSPHEYITRRRMQRAAEDLLSTDMPVSDIASASGYEHPGHFAAAFKRAFGDNPISFRRSRRSLGARLCDDHT